MNRSVIISPKPSLSKWTMLFLSLIAVLVLPFIFFEKQIEALVNSAIAAVPGGPILAVLVGGALALDVILPVPSSLVNAVAGATFGFLFGTLVCWVGMTLGCIFGYWIGATGGTALIRKLMGQVELKRAEILAVRLGGAAVVLLRAVPVLAEASTLAAGAARYPLGPFLLLTSSANLGIAAAYSGIGAYAWSTNSFLLAFAGAISIPVVAYAVMLASSRWTGLASGIARVEPENPIETLACEFAVPYSYPAVFTRGLFDPANPHLVNAVAGDRTEKPRCVVLIDDGLAHSDPSLEKRVSAYFLAHSNRMVLLEAPKVLPGGEVIKGDFAEILNLYRMFLRNGVDRHSYVIAIGGGAVLDAVGFAAATAHRGLRHIRVPTTVLSQNDSGVGVKNAINFDGVKNYVGTFAPPHAVLNDFDFLNALPRRERIAGISEAIKVALIRDLAFFDWLERNADALARFEPKAEEYMVRRSAELHSRQITKGGDPFETGSARPLDFGHWSAHKLEGITKYALRHGEAVAIGIALDTRYSVLSGRLSAGEDDRVVTLLDRIGLPTWHDVLEQRDPEGELLVLEGLREFQEHLGGALTVTLLQKIGTGVEVHEINPQLVREAIAWLKSRRHMV